MAIEEDQWKTTTKRYKRIFYFFEDLVFFYNEAFSLPNLTN